MRFALRHVYLFVALISGACSRGDDRATNPRSSDKSPAANAPAADPQAEARVTTAIEKMGADVSRDATLPGKPATRVSFWNTQVTDAYMKELAVLKHLSMLDLRSTQVTDAGLKELGALPELRDLDLSETEVTDAGLKDLARISKLDTLHLDKTQVTDAGIKELAKLKLLRWVSFWQCKAVTEAGAKELQRALPKAHVVFEPASKAVRPRR